MNTFKALILSSAVATAFLFIPTQANAYSYYNPYQYQPTYNNGYGNCYYHGSDGACYNYSTYSYPNYYGNTYNNGYGYNNNYYNNYPVSYHPYDTRTRRRSYRYNGYNNYNNYYNGYNW